MTPILPRPPLDPLEIWREGEREEEEGQPTTPIGVTEAPDATTLPLDGFGKTTQPSHDSPSRPGAGAWNFVGAGALIDGKYRIERELGRGGMGVVALARDEALDRYVALKLIRSEPSEPGFRERFFQEARAMARVNHVNVVQIYACGEHDAVPYFVMELVDGSTLEQWIKESARDPELATAVRILERVCEGLTAIHAAGTLHLDIKPSNILLDADLQPRIADLGVSTVYRTDGLARAELVGTPAYMAPEVAFSVPGKRATPRADVYSLGCVAYELLTGQPPFTAKDERQLLLQQATAPVPLPSEVRPGLPVAFDAVLVRALAKDPEKRTPSAEAFRHDLLIANGDIIEPVRILIVEDDLPFRELVEVHMQRAFPEAEIACVSSGETALQALQERTASVVILDLNLLNMDGFEVTRRLRALESTRNVPIIVLSGSASPADWKRLSVIGADRFLVKPVNFDDLVTSVRHSLRERARSSDTPGRMDGGAGSGESAQRPS